MSPTGGYATAVGLALPPPRGNVPVPLSIQYTGTGQAGAAGIGWDVPLSYVRRSASPWHRKPAAASSAVVVPERIVLSLGGGQQLMVPSAEDGVWLPLLGDEYMELRRNPGGSWTLSTGAGVDYRFDAAGHDLWLLAEVRDRVGTDRVELGYVYSDCGVGEPVPELQRLRYAFDGAGAPLYDVALEYRPVRKPSDAGYSWPVCTADVEPSPGPNAVPMPELTWRVFGRVDLEGTLLSRSRVISRVRIDARNNLDPSAAPRTIRSYQLTYSEDFDTGAPRLAAVDVLGEEGSGAPPLPLARYRYGAIDEAGVTFSPAQVIPIDPAAVAAGADSLAGSSYQKTLKNFSPPNNGLIEDLVRSRHVLRDFTGDLIPDLVFKDGDTWHLRRGVLTEHGFSLEDGPSTSWTSPSEIHVTRTFTELNLAVASNRQKMTTTETLVMFVDWNGDQRPDIVDARTGDPNRWDVWLNLPASDGTIAWSRRDVLVSDLVDHIGEHQLDLDLYFDTDWTPIERSRTWPKFVDYSCKDHYRQLITPQNETVADCNPDDPVSFTEDRIVDTVGEWMIQDYNSDGFPDLLVNTVPVRHEECDHDCPFRDTRFTNCEAEEVWTPVYGPDGTIIGEELRCEGIHQEWLTTEGNRVAVLLNRAGALVNTGDGYESTLLDVGHLGVSRFTTGDGQDGALRYRMNPSDALSVAGFVDAYGVGSPRYAGSGRFASDRDDVCTPDADPDASYTSTQTSGRVDLNGDAVPDNVYRDDDGSWKVRFGSTAGLGPPRPIASAVPFAISEAVGTCGGTSSTVAGLVDLDGDGRPEIVRFVNGQLVAAKIMTSDAGNGIAAGRLIEIDNGLGASTRITYANNKADTTTSHDVPVPEVVVSRTQVFVDDRSAPHGHPVRFAYGTPEMRFVPALGRQQFAGYRRHVTLVGETPRCDGGFDCLIDGYAIVVDRTPQAVPGAGFAAIARGGRVAQTTRLEGLFLPDPRPILDLDVYAGYRRAQSTHEYQVTELEVAPWSTGDVGRTECIDVDPHSGVAPNAFDLVCHRAGVVRATVSSAWEGLEAPDQGADNVYVGVVVLDTDERGRPTEIVDYGDLRTIADDRCTLIHYAIPQPGSSPVTSVVAATWVTDCGWKRATVGVGGVTPGEPLLLSARRFRYDDLPEGRVGRGRPTSSVLETFDTSTGEFLGEHVVASMSYDALGEVREVVATRALGSAAIRTSTFVYDSFGASVRSIVEKASDVAQSFEQQIVASTWPSVPHEVHGLNGERTITARDGFGRAIRTRIVAPGTDHVVSRTIYDDLGRQITGISFPVTADLPQTSHVHLDALGRPRFRQVELGADYGNTTLIAGLVEYDGMGRVIYQADPFEWPVLPFAPEDLSEDKKSWPYGTSLVHDAIGRLERRVEAPGHRPEQTISDVGADVFVSDVRHTWNDGQAVVQARGPSENDLGSPSAGVRAEQRMTGLGWPVEEARYTLAGVRLDLVRRGFDRFGRETALVRYRNPVSESGPVTWTRRRDSRGLVLELVEPGTSPRLSSYDEWGALLESEWLDESTRRRTRQRYDGLGRPTASAIFTTPVGEAGDSIEFAEEYHYDKHSGSPLQPQSALLGRMSRIEARGVGDVYFGYDAFGRSTSEVTLLAAHGTPMGTSRSYQPGGAVRELRFDTPAGVDVIAYVLDSAARIRRIADVGTGTDLFGSAELDAEGRYQRFQLGNGVVEKFKYARTGREDLGHWSIETASGVQAHDFLSRDAEGRLLGERYNQQGFTFDVVHEYDALDRLVRSAALTSTPLASQDEEFSYDHLGNFKTQRNLFNSSLNRDYTVDPADPDRLCRFDPVGQSGSGCTFLYDGAGNLRSDTWSGTRKFTYDSASRITSIGKGAWRASFFYGPGGALARTDVRRNSALDRRIWRFGDLIEERTRPDGRTQIERRVPGPLGIVATLRTEGGVRETVYVHGDGRGNRFFTKADGTLSQQVRYRAFGGVVADTGQTSSLTYSDDLWNGGDDLQELGVVILGARVYDPLIGRFLQRDPISLWNPATRGNPYSFSYNDPVNYSDPTGLCVESGCVEVAFDALGVAGLGWLAKRAYDQWAGDVRVRTHLELPQPPLPNVDFNLLSGKPINGYSWWTGELDWGAVVENRASGQEMLDQVQEEAQRQAISAGACMITFGTCVGVNTSQAGDEGEAGASVVFGVGGGAGKPGGTSPGRTPPKPATSISSGAAHGVGFGSFDAFKKAVGPAGTNMQWHHVVEQTSSNVARFGPTAVHNTGNLIRIDVGVHRQVSGYYSSIQPQVTGSSRLTIREWLSTQSFEAQQAFGRDVLIRHGVLP